MTSHALNTETMATWKKTRFDHEVEAQTTVSFYVLVLFVIQNLDDISHFIFELLKFLVELLLRNLGIILDVVIESILCLLSLHVSVLVGLHGQGLSILVKVNDFVFNPVSILFVKSPPLSQNLSFLHIVVLFLQFRS